MKVYSKHYLLKIFNMHIKIKKLHPEAKLPKYALPGDVGMDLFSLEEKIINPGEHLFVMHGFALEFPTGYAAIVMDKSSISKAGLHTMGGVFDAGYRGEYNTHLVNLSSEPYTVEEGDTDLEGLAKVFDSNKDGVLDANDSEFDKFRIWQDKDGDGISDAGEVKTLTEMGIKSIGVVSDGKAYIDAGNTVHGTASYTKMNYARAA